MDKKMLEALNKQINEELFSSYLYLAMSADFAAKNLNGAAHWMSMQAKEELGHAMKIFGYINERGERAVLEAIEKPAESWDSMLEAFEASLAHEQHITGCINDLMAMAHEVKDFATIGFLQWFVDEQVEEEATADGIVQMLKMAGDKGHVLLMIDRQLASRSAG